MEDYFGTHLHPFQRFLFYMMNKDDKFMYIAARGRFGRLVK
ncbi:Putative phage protein (plasmid) [Ligilactobacillus salivarius]|nr:Putative phage protein [Ligilactobacillus salivarius]